MDIDVGVMIFIEIYCIELYINRYDYFKVEIFGDFFKIFDKLCYLFSMLIKKYRFKFIFFFLFKFIFYIYRMNK